MPNTHQASQTASDGATRATVADIAPPQADALVGDCGCIASDSSDRRTHATRDSIYLDSGVGFFIDQGNADRAALASNDVGRPGKCPTGC